MNKLTQSKYFAVRTWSEANKETLLPLNIAAHATVASDHFQYTVSPESIRTMRKDMEWVQKIPGAESSEEISALKTRIDTLEDRIDSLEQLVLPLDKPHSPPPQHGEPSLYLN